MRTRLTFIVGLSLAGCGGRTLSLGEGTAASSAADATIPFDGQAGSHLDAAFDVVAYPLCSTFDGGVNCGGGCAPFYSGRSCETGHGLAYCTANHAWICPEAEAGAVDAEAYPSCSTFDGGVNCGGGCAPTYEGRACETGQGPAFCTNHTWICQ